MPLSGITAAKFLRGTTPAVKCVGCEKCGLAQFFSNRY
jgi:hypothetical protein